MSRTRVQTLTAATALLLSLAACGTAGVTPGAAPATTSPATTSPATTSPATTSPTADLPPALRGLSADTSTSGTSSGLTASSTDGATMQQYLTAVLTDVDAYWSGVFSAAGLPAPYVQYSFPSAGQVRTTACAPDYTATDSTAAYCPADDTIYFGETAATRIWQGELRTNRDPESGQQAGDFSVAYALAHEYAHDLQKEVGILGGAQDYPVYKTELHADCWAGVWANSAYFAGTLQAGDVEEAVRTTGDIGDYEFGAPDHHGTPAQRSTAFMTGYNSGAPRSCDTFLTSDYS